MLRTILPMLALACLSAPAAPGLAQATTPNTLANMPPSGTYDLNPSLSTNLSGQYRDIKLVISVDPVFNVQSWREVYTVPKGASPSFRSLAVGATYDPTQPAPPTVFTFTRTTPAIMVSKTKLVPPNPGPTLVRANPDGTQSFCNVNESASNDQFRETCNVYDTTTGKKVGGQQILTFNLMNPAPACLLPAPSQTVSYQNATNTNPLNGTWVLQPQLTNPTPTASNPAQYTDMQLTFAYDPASSFSPGLSPTTAAPHAPVRSAAQARSMQPISPTMSASSHSSA